MQTIFKAHHTSRFNFVGSDFCNSKIPSDPKNVLLYLIDKPDDWKLIVKAIANTLGLTVYAVRKALRWLVDHGYATYKRLADGSTIWQIFEQPKQAAIPVFTPRVEIPHVEIQHDIHINQTALILQNTTTPPALIEPLADQKPNVVVQRSIDETELHQAHTNHSDNRLRQRETTALNRRDCLDVASNTDGIGIDTTTVIAKDTDGIGIDAIPSIDNRHQQVARKALAKLTVEQAQAVLTVFTLAASKGSISNKIGYLIGLTKAALNGTFSPVQPHTAPPALTAAQRLAKERQREHEAQARGRMTNQEHAEWLQRTYGTATKPSTTVPHQGVKSLKLALNIL